MRTLRSLDVLTDGELQARVVRWSFVLMVPLFVAGVVVGASLALGRWGRLSGLPFWEWLLIWGVVSVAVLPVHELIHAAFFRLFGGPGTQVIFGFSQFMLYAGSPGLVLPRAKFVWVLLAPATLITGSLLVVPWALGEPFLALCLADAHLAGCSGDLIMTACALREPGCTHVRDTEVGCDLLGP